MRPLAAIVQPAGNHINVMRSVGLRSLAETVTAVYRHVLPGHEIAVR
jgi:hypothetical protein